MRQVFKKPKFEEPKDKLLGAMDDSDESNQLSRILNLIAEQQKELKGYIERIDQAHRDLDSLNVRKSKVEEETAKAEQANESLNAKYRRDLDLLSNEISLRQQTLSELNTRQESEILRINKQINELQSKATSEETKHFEQLSSYQRVLAALGEKQAELMATGIFLEDKNKEAKQQIENAKQELETIIARSVQQKTDLSDQIESLRTEVSGLTVQKLNLVEENKSFESQNHNLKAWGVNHKKEIELKIAEEIKKAEDDKLAKQKETIEINKEFEKAKGELMNLKRQQEEINKTIATFLAKKETVDRREKVLHQKYEDAGFTW